MVTILGYNFQVEGGPRRVIVTWMDSRYVPRTTQVRVVTILSSRRGVKKLVTMLGCTRHVQDSSSVARRVIVT